MDEITEKLKEQFVNDNCLMIACENRSYCIQRGYICPAVLQLNSKIKKGEINVGVDIK